MIVWRLCRPEHAALDGEGAFRFGGRWNSPGARIVYTSAHLSLAVLEILVHTGPADFPDGMVKLEISVPERLSVERAQEKRLPASWRSMEANARTRRYGDRWIAGGQSAVLRIPSVVIPEEDNLLINPDHPDMAHVSVIAQTPFTLDPRLVHGNGRPAT